MKKNIMLIALTILVPFVYPLSIGALTDGKSGNNEAADIIKKVDTVNNVTDLKMEMTMTIIDKRDVKTKKKFTRIEKLDGNNDSKVLIRFLEPPDVKGTSFLTVEHTPGDDEMWVYFASMRKVRRIAISSTDRKDQFMGSDFTYGDMNRKVSDYNYSFIKEEKLGPVNCYVIEEIPIDQNIKDNDGYSKKIEWISKDNYLVMKTEYYDLQKKLEKVTINSEPASLGNNKWTIKKYEIHNLLRNHKTIIDLDKIEVNQGIRDEMFSTNYLQRASW
ncbi:MAG: outer membrane lipoprotein-sorting protein [Candidatus Omnitrophota bacterium]